VFTRHVSRQLARYCDGQLGAAEARLVDAHLASCARCRMEREEIRFAAGLIRQLTVAAAPDAIWAGIARQLDTGPTRRSWELRPALVWAAAVALVAVVGVWVLRAPERPWDVATLTQGATSTSRMAAGEWVETADDSRARIVVGSIGTVDVDPGTRVRLGAVLPEEYRLALARGTIRARISAPPRLFIVDTPASTVVDLGCAYTVQVDDAGTGDLRVTEGWASLEWKGRESLVPAGARCRIRSGVGPGTPFFEDASPALQRAVADFDFAGGGSSAVATILTESRARDTLTLWHLLSRVAAADRVRVYDRMVELTPLPADVERDKALQLDQPTLTRWRQELAWTW
jgi:hypothetical protein